MPSTPSNKTHGDAEPSKCFSTVILPESPAAASSQKNLTGLPRVARDIVADLFNNIQKWNDNHIKGANLTKCIAQLKSDNTVTYPEGLENLTNDLSDIIEKLSAIAGALEFLTTQMKSLIKLHKQSNPLFTSLSNDQIMNLTENIVDAYKAEFKVKEFVFENMAHAVNKTEIMFYAACWVHQQNITSEVNFKLEALLTETGHRKIL